MNESLTTNANARAPGLVFMVNSSIAVGFLQGQLQYLQGRGFDITVLCPERKRDEWEVPMPEGVRMTEVDMERGIAIWRDLTSLWRMCRILRVLHPAVTNAGTPKAGLLGGFAAWVNRVPCRYYTLHGLRFETTKGLRRRLLVLAERLACRFAHRVICVSHSAREKAIASGLTDKGKIVILGSGSCNGVDCSRFAPTPQRIKLASEKRQKLGIPEAAKVVTFVGRMTADKGISELAEAFLRLEGHSPEVWLLLVGCFEDDDPVPPPTRRFLEAHPRVILAGPVRDTSVYYTMSDAIVLASHREGLPTVVLEAQAAGLPVVGASATGIVDVIEHGETGLLFPVGNVSALADALTKVLDDPSLAARLKQAGQESVRQKFRQELVWEANYREYVRLLQTKKPHWPADRTSMWNSVPPAQNQS